MTSVESYHVSFTSDWSSHPTGIRAKHYRISVKESAEMKKKKTPIQSVGFASFASLSRSIDVNLQLLR